MDDINEVGKKAKEAAEKLLNLSTVEKNKILSNMARILDENRCKILEANKIDLKNAMQKGISQSLLDRLILNDKRMDSMITSVREVEKMNECIGEVVEKRILKNGLELKLERVPFGVVAIIYEARPNVTADVCSLCFKASSACILKGGSEALESNKVIVNLFRRVCSIENAFQLIESTDREETKELLSLRKYIDVVIPRGGAELIEFVRNNSRIPIIETGSGNCHIYVDEDADVDKAIKIIINAKTQRPAVCNAVETVLIHQKIASKIIYELNEKLKDKNVEIRGCKRVKEFIVCIEATEDDWKTEYLDLILAIKIVNNLDEAIDHINKYGTKHSEAILSRNKENIKKFFKMVDSAVLYSNASTRFTDGYEFGLGSEIGISTQKLHARGPMGLKALTTVKYLINGDGQTRE